MQILKNFAILLLIAGFAFSSCTKPGLGGEAAISAFPKHHEQPIPDCAVFIKYDAKEFPGTDLSVYDDFKIAEDEPGQGPHAHFESLKKGDYYLYGVGFDSSLNAEVRGGIPVEIKEKAGETVIVLPVTE